MTVAMLTGLEPQSFVPPGDRAFRLSHLDPRPLRPAARTVESAWRSPTFWVACLLVLPVAAIVAVVRASWRVFARV